MSNKKRRVSFYRCGCTRTWAGVFLFTLLFQFLGGVFLQTPQARAADPLTGSVAREAQKKIAGGGFHSLAVNSDGMVVAWGADNDGQTDVPAGLSDVVAVSAGLSHSLALKADGTVDVWGDNTYHQTDVPTGLSNVKAIAAGAFHSLALKTDGTVVAWGDNSYHSRDVPEDLSNVEAIAAGWFFSLALKSDGTVVAWGDYRSGQTDVPAGLSDVEAIAAGKYHSLALKKDGTVVAWGSDFNHQSDVPAGLSNVVAIAAGGYHSLALKSDGTILAWGYGANGQTDVPAGLNDAVAIAAGEYHSFALKSDGTVVAWAGFTDVPAGLNLIDSHLKSLSVSPGTMSFNPDVMKYTVNVDYSTTRLDITAQLNDENFTSFMLDGQAYTSGMPESIPVKVGSQTMVIIVWDIFGTVPMRTYVVTVNRAAPLSSNADLANLTLSEGRLSPSFATGTVEYAVYVPYRTASIELTQTLPDGSAATVKVNGQTVASGTATSVNLNEGENTIPIEVTSEDGSTTKSYTVTVNRERKQLALPVVSVVSGVSFTTLIYDPDHTYVGTFSNIDDNGITGSITGTQVGTSPYVSLSGTLTGSSSTDPVEIQLAQDTHLYVRIIQPPESGGTFEVSPITP